MSSVTTYNKAKLDELLSTKLSEDAARGAFGTWLEEEGVGGVDSQIDTSMLFGNLIAHRAQATLTSDENTIEALLELPKWVQGVEIDARLTSDGVPVLMHDTTVERTTTGTGTVSAMTAAQVAALTTDGGNKVPTLATFLLAASTQDLDAVLVHIPGDQGTNTDLMTAVANVITASPIAAKCIVMVNASDQMTRFRTVNTTLRMGCYQNDASNIANRIETALAQNAELLLTTTAGNGYLDHRGIVPTIKAAGLDAGATVTNDLKALGAARLDACDWVLTDRASELDWYAGGRRRTPGVYSAAINPSTLGTAVQFWFDANDVAVADGAAVATWTDKSTFGRNATQATAGAQPVRAASGINGHPAVVFDGVDDMLKTAVLGAPLAQPNWLFVVAQVVTPRTAGDYPIVDGADSAGRHVIGLSENAGTLAWYISSGTRILATGGAPNHLNPHAFVAQLNSPTSTLSVDGTTVLSGATTGTHLMAGLALGNRGSDGARALNVKIGEVVALDTATPEQAAGVLTYLRQKWGV